MWKIFQSIFGTPPKNTPPTAKSFAAYQKVIEKVGAMVQDKKARSLVSPYDLQILNVLWEDTARFKNSAVGPNISDLTIQVRQKNSQGSYDIHCMPVIRFPNFSDVTGDISSEKLFLWVGNEQEAEQPLEKVSLAQFLRNLRGYLHDGGSWAGEEQSLWDEDLDGHVLVSAQACFLPLPSEGLAEFNPVLFNYQSRVGDPGVMTILCTTEGTSVTIIDNQRDSYSEGRAHGQQLFFNAHGKKTVFTGRRLTDHLVQDLGREATAEEYQEAAQKGMNMLLLIQVPLMQKKAFKEEEYDTVSFCMPPPVPQCSAPRSKGWGSPQSDVEEAVLGHGPPEGPFVEVDNLSIKRDCRYPIRVTVQFYKATSNGVIDPDDIQEIASQIKSVYEEADFVGSLVVQGETNRPTEYTGNKVEPPDWWEKFWEKHQAETGESPQECFQRLERILGPRWNQVSLQQGYQALFPKKDSSKE